MINLKFENASVQLESKYAAIESCSVDAESSNSKLMCISNLLRNRREKKDTKKKVPLKNIQKSFINTLRKIQLLKTKSNLMILILQKQSQSYTEVCNQFSTMVKNFDKLLMKWMQMRLSFGITEDGNFILLP